VRRTPITWILAGLILSLGACRKPADSLTPAVSNETPTPTQTMDHFTLQDLRNGQKAMKLDAIQARLFETENYAEVEQPLVVFYQAGAESSTMKAPKGKVNLLTHEMEAWGGVTLVTSDSATLTTERMRYDPKVRKVFSNDPVHLVRSDSVTDGQGLESDPELRVVKIKRQTVQLKQHAGN
jgi:LPS export ABC transporter protein LptC